MDGFKRVQQFCTNPFNLNHLYQILNNLIKFRFLLMFLNHLTFYFNKKGMAWHGMVGESSPIRKTQRGMISYSGKRLSFLPCFFLLPLWREGDK